MAGEIPLPTVSSKRWGLSLDYVIGNKRGGSPNDYSKANVSTYLAQVKLTTNRFSFTCMKKYIN